MTPVINTSQDSGSDACDQGAPKCT